MAHLSIKLDIETEGFDAIGLLKNRLGIEDMASLVERGDVIHMGDDAQIEIGALEAGMESGNPSIAFAFTLPDGRVALIETSMALFTTAQRTLAARYGDGL